MSCRLKCTAWQSTARETHKVRCLAIQKPPPAVRRASKHPRASFGSNSAHWCLLIIDPRVAAAQYIIIGSANINQRSLDGSRDSEIAVGGFQPYHVAAPDLPRGDVRTLPRLHRLPHPAVTALATLTTCTTMTFDLG